MELKVINTYLGKEFKYTNDNPTYTATGKFTTDEYQENLVNTMNITMFENGIKFATIKAKRISESDFQIIDAKLGISNVEKTTMLIKVIVRSLQEYKEEVIEMPEGKNLPENDIDEEMIDE